MYQTSVLQHIDVIVTKQGGTFLLPVCIYYLWHAFCLGLYCLDDPCLIIICRYDLRFQSYQQVGMATTIIIYSQSNRAHLFVEGKHNEFASQEIIRSLGKTHNKDR